MCERCTRSNKQNEHGFEQNIKNYLPQLVVRGEDSTEVAFEIDSKVFPKISYDISGIYWWHCWEGRRLDKFDWTHLPLDSNYNSTKGSN